MAQTLTATFSSADLNPIDFSNSWSFIKIGSVQSPGIIEAGGMKGFDRSVNWDKKIGKGSAGATMTQITMPPAKGSIEFTLWTPQQFTQWGAFRMLLNYIPGKAPKTPLQIDHPALNDLNVNSVLTEKISPVLYHGKGKYKIKVDFIEFIPPPKQSIVVTPPKSIPKDPSTIPGNHPELAAKQARLKMGLATAAKLMNQ